MQRSSVPDAVASSRQRICQVLAGAPFPAARWQLMAHAEHYGADAATRSDLWRLPAAVYDDLPSVLVSMGLLPERPGGRGPR